MLFHLLLYCFIFPENCFYNVHALPSKLEKYFCFGKKLPLMYDIDEGQDAW